MCNVKMAQKTFQFGNRIYKLNIFDLKMRRHCIVLINKEVNAIQFPVKVFRTSKHYVHIPVAFTPLWQSAFGVMEKKRKINMHRFPCLLST